MEDARKMDAIEEWLLCDSTLSEIERIANGEDNNLRPGDE